MDKNMTALTPAAEEGERLLMDAYYYGFTPTGCLPVDRILSAVASAGQGYHNTEDWNEGNPSPVEKIQAAADEAARLLSSPRVEGETIPFDKTDLAQLQQVREELRNRWRASAWQLLCRTIDDLESRATLSPQGG